jgi:hypothetical protein
MVAALREPPRMLSLCAPDWEDIIAQGLTGALQGVLAGKARGLPDFEALPRAARLQFEAVEAVTAYNRRVLAWEVNRIGLALRDVGCPVVLLKGAAYNVRRLPSLAGRLASDVDILVPKDHIAAVEAALKAAGWHSMPYSEYDERYYRDWMHEIPPLQNADRGTYVDVHHTILPETGRLKPDVDRLFREAEPIEGSNLLTLSDVDMTLHTVVHCFQDGEFASRLRDIVDVDGLLRDFGGRDGFWRRLLEASDAHGFGRPLYYALHFCRRLLGTEVPADVWKHVKRHAPNPLARLLMNYAVPRAVMPSRMFPATAQVRLAQTMLLARSHWLKMPPLLLLRHLSRKAAIRRGKKV